MLHHDRVPVNSFEFSTLVVLPRRVLNALTAALKGGNPPTLSTHRLRGLPELHLILFATRFRASASVTDQRVAFATGVPPYIYAFHRYVEFHSPLSIKFPVSNDPLG